MINKEKYLSELKKVIIEKYPTGNYNKYQLLRNDSPVRHEMDDYVMKNYGEYYKKELIQLVKVKNAIYTECIEELNI